MDRAGDALAHVARYCGAIDFIDANYVFSWIVTRCATGFILQLRVVSAHADAALLTLDLDTGGAIIWVPIRTSFIRDGIRKSPETVEELVVSSVKNDAMISDDRFMSGAAGFMYRYKVAIISAEIERFVAQMQMQLITRSYIPDPRPIPVPFLSADITGDMSGICSTSIIGKRSREPFWRRHQFAFVIHNRNLFNSPWCVEVEFTKHRNEYSDHVCVFRTDGRKLTPFEISWASPEDVNMSEHNRARLEVNLAREMPAGVARMIADQLFAVLNHPRVEIMFNHRLHKPREIREICPWLALEMSEID